jgi:hypothetical protein
VHSAVRKREWHATQAERREHGLVGDGAKGEHRAEPGQVGDLGGEKSAAGCDLGGVRFVLRRNATDRVGNTNSAQRESVIGARIVDPLGEAEFAQRLIEQPAGVIAGEGTARPVRSFETGGEPDDQQLRMFIAKGGNRCVEPLWMGVLLRLPVCCEARAERAIPRRLRLQDWSGHASSTGSVRGR